MRVLLTRRWPAAVEEAMALRYEVTRNTTDTPLTEAQLRDALLRFDVICPTVTDQITASLIADAEPRTRLLCNFGAGTDHIALAAFRERGIAVTNTPDVLSDATAELALTLMLMVARRCGEGERLVRAGAWRGWAPTDLMGVQLQGRTLGLIGFGRIARNLARKAAAALGMTIIYHAPHRATAEAEAEYQAGYRGDLDALLAEADVVSLHCPSTPDTFRLIDSSRLSRMKPGAILINTARGAVVDETALAEALQAGRLGGAGLDVYVNEPSVNPKLLELENAVLLPHLGSATQETRRAMGMKALANLEAFSEGRPLPDPVN
jgi:lactate dehydrogenase-like 2-hydroxyacid dehydrogenase